jgi:NAD(P)-dependent dehydrogenase (short-subunit alcohol dehydrogenase family)
MIQDFAGQTVIVTGGSRGIGFAIAQGFAAAQAQVVIASKNEARGQAAAERLQGEGGEVVFIRTDVTNRDEVEQMVAQVLERFGSIDVLVNNAGVSERAPFTEEDEAMWLRMYRGNVLGTVFPSQAVVRHMQQRGEGGSIVHIASKAGVVGEPGHAAYSAAKGAVIALTREMAVELGPDRIRVNVVNPGPVITDMLLEAIPDADERAALAAQAPLGRLGEVDDIVGAVLLLASPASALITGQSVNIDGGMSVLL